MEASHKLSRKLVNAQAIHVSTGAKLGARGRFPLGCSPKPIGASGVSPVRAEAKTMLGQGALEGQLETEKLSDNRWNKICFADDRVSPCKHSGTVRPRPNLET